MLQSLSIFSKSKKIFKNISPKVRHPHKLYESTIVECQWAAYLDGSFGLIWKICVEFCPYILSK